MQPLSLSLRFHGAGCLFSAFRSLARRCSCRRDCHSAAPPSPFVRCFNRDGEGGASKTTVSPTLLWPQARTRTASPRGTNGRRSGGPCIRTGWRSSRYCSRLVVQGLATWHILQKHGPNHLGMRCNACPERQLVLITSNCVPFSGPPESFRCGTPQHGLSSQKIALITSDYGIMCSLSIKLAQSSRVMCLSGGEDAIQLSTSHRNKEISELFAAWDPAKADQINTEFEKKMAAQAWTILQKYGPNHLGLRCNACPEHQLTLITSNYVRRSANSTSCRRRRRSLR